MDIQIKGSFSKYITIMYMEQGISNKTYIYWGDACSNVGGTGGAEEEAAGENTTEYTE